MKRKIYSVVEVARHVCRHGGDVLLEGQRACMNRWTRWLLEESPAGWERVTVPVKLIQSVRANEPCTKGRIAGYVKRRRSGSKFPPIVLFSKRGGIPWEGNHRSRAAECVGDKTIDAFVPAPKVERRLVGRRKHGRVILRTKSK